MSIVTPSPQSPTVVVTPASAQHIVIKGADWRDYIAIADAIPDGSSIHTTFDGWNVQLMTISPEHEYFKTVLRKLIETLSLERGIDSKGGGSLTLRSTLVEQGLEPDECFWFKNAQQVLGMKRWDPREYPPPDLVIEIDITSASIRRQPIYGKLGVPEIWRYDGTTLTSLHLTQDGEYVSKKWSRTFPFLRVADLQTFIEAAEELTDLQLIRRFIDWIREQDFNDAVTSDS